MKTFMDHNFLLQTETAKELYHKYAETVPILDYHCHISPKEIAENRQFKNITEVWLGGDHYKWRLMRSNGVEEYYITGNAEDYEKFEKWAYTLEKAIGNPLYHWSHLELKNYFGYEGVLNHKTAKQVWELCNKKLKQDSMSARGLIEQSHVTLICTTDDPIDSLEYHKQIAEDNRCKVIVLPAWRPDKAMNLEKSDYKTYLEKLSHVSSIDIYSFDQLMNALKNRMEFFHKMGCKVSDHALEYVMYQPVSKETVDEIFQKRLNGKEITRKEELQFKTAFMSAIAKEYNRLGWVMQLHYGCKRDNNTPMYEILGADTGYDCINNFAPSSEMADFLNCLNKTEELPKTILYSLNPNDDAIIDSILGCFQTSPAVGKIQHGSAWWFNDNKEGMENQMKSLANLGSLASFIGMLTDSRSFLSYTRHEYFRRILCNLLGNWVENGEFPQDYDILEEIVKNISYNNAVRYFEFPLKTI